MRIVFSFLCFILSVCSLLAGIFVAIRYMLVGGIVLAAEGFNSVPINYTDMTIGIVMAIFFELPIAFGTILAFLFGVFGIGILSKEGSFNRTVRFRR